MKVGDKVECLDIPHGHGISVHNIYTVYQVDKYGEHIWIQDDSGKRLGGWKSSRFRIARPVVDVQLVLKYLKAYRDETNNREAWLGVKELIEKWENMP